jgi:hypothetical protein
MAQVRLNEEQQYNAEVYFKLKEAEAEAKATAKRYSHEEVIKGLREKLTNAK